MKRSILNLRNVQVLTVEQQKSISGGGRCGCPSDGHGITKNNDLEWVNKP